LGEGLLELLREQRILALFVIVGVGLLLGRIRVAGTPAGSVTGVLAVGLLAGHLGIGIPETTDNVAFLLFIYVVGFQAGPNFLSVFRENGLGYLLLAVVTAGAGLTVAWTASALIDLPSGAPAGLLAGALTSTPTLVAAQDALTQGIPLPPGVTPADASANVSAAYAITYLVGLTGILAFVAAFPRLARIDLAAEARKLGESRGGGGVGSYSLLRPSRPPTVRAYRVEKDETVGLRYGDRPGTYDLAIQKMKRDGEVMEVDDDTVFRRGDLVSIIGTADVHKGLRDHVGPEVLDYDVLDRSVESRRLVLTRKEAAGHRLEELDFVGRYRCWLTAVTRGGQRLPRRPGLVVERGDVLVLTGAAADLDRVAEFVGYEEARLEETDMVTFAFGIAVGVLAGRLSFHLGDIPIGLGSAGGVMVAGLVFGLLGSTRPTFGRLPAGARHILMELGLLFFMAGVAVDAGTTFVSTLREAGLPLLVAAAAVMLVPLLICYAVGRFALRMNGALLLGAMTGALTSTAALKQVNAAARSSVPMLGYVGTYTFANVLLTIAGGVLMRIL
jgi:putative transport protein